MGLRGWSRRMREISLFVTFLLSVFLFLYLAYSLQVATFRAGSALWGLDDKFNIFSIFSSKILKCALRPTATSNCNNSGIFKDGSKTLVPGTKGGVFCVGNLASSSKFAEDRSLLPCHHGNQLMVFEQLLTWYVMNLQFSFCHINTRSKHGI